MRGLTLLVSLSLFAGCALAQASAASAGPCPNEALRTGFNASLPECRAYELVSPPGTAPELEFRSSFNEDMYRGSTPQGQPTGVNVSATGEKLAFFSEYAPAASGWDSQYFIASRGAQGWSTTALVPPQTPEYTIVCHNAYAVAFSTELTSWLLGDGWGQSGSADGLEGCGRDDPELVQREPQGFQNLFVSEGLTAPYQLVDVTPSGVQPADAWFETASSDLNHVVFEEQAQLTPQAPASEDLYVWTAGAAPAVRLVTILPDGTTTEGFLANRPDEETSEGNFFRHGPEIYTHAMSTDGSRVFFYANGGLYMRENAYREQSALQSGKCAEPEKACTLQIDASQVGVGGGGGKFRWASATGSRVFFTDSERLTSDSTAAAGSPDLYEYDFAAAEGARLRDLTVNAGEPADVQAVSGVSEDGSRVYFVADGKLTNEENSHGDTAIAGQPNLYVVAQDGEPTYIATLDPTYDNMDWDVKTLTARVSDNGLFIAFDSQLQLTGYDNTPLEPADCVEGERPLPCTEIFLYDAQQRQLSCVSCNPTGAPPTAPSFIQEPEDRPMDYNGLIYQRTPSYLQHNVTDQGQVFFDTAEPLTPQATNGLVNVYEYREGERRLLSTATSNVGAYFYEASPSGDDVFLTSSQPLAAGALGSEYSVFDARVNGGFAEQGKPTACSEEDCRGALTPTPLLGAPSSQTFVGAGNVSTMPAPKPIGKPKPESKKRRGKHRRRRRVGHRKVAGAKRSSLQTRARQSKRGGVR